MSVGYSVLRTWSHSFQGAKVDGGHATSGYLEAADQCHPLGRAAGFVGAFIRSFDCVGNFVLLF